ncbi:hypothetical protein DLAC_10327 [Tieghemostelium lacteum]|uniref:WD40 repeat-containing protein n=1 Tax=Tieghemostelium lacteum TaxID=361077 RepID=A0A151Z558_TIELA|nr:hypothetical protein DLAC_10327 [Tieghemostelium lacteum]|eukprot:KYQ89096.1 hypothetical protein DLAC_10327 [Tieghemostelium lacteum]
MNNLNHLDFKDLQLRFSTNEFIHSIQKENFLKGSKWSPDGTCLLTCSDDNHIRLFEIPIGKTIEGEDQNKNLNSILKVRESSTIYDYCWFPLMNSNDRNSSCFLSTGKDSSLSLWDAFTGQLRCKYLTYKDSDYIESAYSCQFNNYSNKIYSGCKNSIKVFNIENPGLDYQEIMTKKQKRKKNRKGKSMDEETDDGLPGIISSFAFDRSFQNGFYTVGTYGGNLGIFDERTDQLIDYIPYPSDWYNGSDPETKVLRMTRGVTHTLISPGGYCLFASYRKWNTIVGWDIRNTQSEIPELYKIERSLDGNQRMYFDIDGCGRYLVTGSQDGELIFYDLQQQTITHRQQMNGGCINSVQFHPQSQDNLVISYGQRQFLLDGDSNPQFDQQDVLDFNSDRIDSNYKNTFEIYGNIKSLVEEQTSSSKE